MNRPCTEIGLHDKGCSERHIHKYVSVVTTVQVA